MSNNEIIKKIAKEIASEVVLKRNDPSYEPVLDKRDCIQRLVLITSRPYIKVEKEMNSEINKFLKTPQIFEW
jgi:hypothetical protein